MVAKRTRHRKKMRGEKSEATARCSRCGETKKRSGFVENKRLIDGVIPWCVDCLAELKESKDKDAAAQYHKDYQRAYQQKRNAKLAADEGRRETARGSQRLTKKLVVDLIPRKLTLAAIRRPGVYSELVLLWDEIKRTNVWQEFEDYILEKAGKTKGRVARVLPELEYPEFALVETNCYVSEIGDPGEDQSVSLLYDDVLEGLERLAKAIIEVGYYDQ